MYFCNMTEALRMPSTTASRKGVSAVAAAAEKRHIVLTSHGREVAIVDRADRLESQLGILRGATWEALNAAANLYSDRSTKHSLDEFCARFGLDVETLCKEH